MLYHDLKALPPWPSIALSIKLWCLSSMQDCVCTQKYGRAATPCQVSVSSGGAYGTHPVLRCIFTSATIRMMTNVAAASAPMTAAATMPL